MTTAHVSPSLIQTIGFLAAAGTTFSLVPQIIRLYRIKRADEISLGMFAFFSLGVLLWLIYGLLLHSWPIIAANIITLALSLTVLILKVAYDRD
jgi:MtN3 and saliva related transmembrane protein